GGDRDIPALLANYATCPEEREQKRKPICSGPWRQPCRATRVHTRQIVLALKNLDQARRTARSGDVIRRANTQRAPSLRILQTIRQRAVAVSLQIKKHDPIAITTGA